MAARPGRTLYATRTPNAVHLLLKTYADEQRRALRDVLPDIVSEYVHERPWTSGIRLVTPAGKTRSSDGWVTITLEATPELAAQIDAALDTIGPARPSVASWLYTGILWWIHRRANAKRDPGAPFDATAAIEAARQFTGLSDAYQPLGLPARGPSRKRKAVSTPAPSAASDQVPATTSFVPIPVSTPGPSSDPASGVIVIRVAPGFGGKVARKVASLPGVVGVELDAVARRELFA
jgi:hypothetical protein